jgi:uncharacterized protein (DUF2141 family)
MKRQILLAPALVLIFWTMKSFQVQRDASFDIQVTVTHIRNEKGSIQIQIYTNQEDFAKENLYGEVVVPKQGKVKDGKMSVLIEGLPKGTYGLALLDDENNNKKMDYSFMIPSEGFGFSDYYHTAWSKPKFEAFKFYLNGNRKSVMKVRYL